MQRGREEESSKYKIYTPVMAGVIYWMKTLLLTAYFHSVLIYSAH